MKNIKTYEQVLSEGVEWVSYTGEYLIPSLDGEGAALWLGSDGSLKNRDLSGEHVRDADFKGEDLSGSNLSECDLSGSSFRSCILRGVDFTEALIHDVSFVGADLTEAKGLHTCEGILFAKFQGADLTGVDDEFFHKVILESNRRDDKGFSITEFFKDCKGVPGWTEEKLKRMKRSRGAFGRF